MTQGQMRHARHGKLGVGRMGTSKVLSRYCENIGTQSKMGLVYKMAQWVEHYDTNMRIPVQIPMAHVKLVASRMSVISPSYNRMGGRNR